MKRLYISGADLLGAFCSKFKTSTTRKIAIIIICVFSRYIAFEGKHQYELYDENVHWRPQNILCNPCAVNYDFVVRFESLAEDSNHLLKYLQRFDPESKKVFFDESRSALINENRTAAAFNDVSKRIMERLKKKYLNDFEIMGYSMDSFG